MDIEPRQAEVIDQFIKQASALKGSALVPLIVEATSNPLLFAFSEILSVPNVREGSYSLKDLKSLHILACCVYMLMAPGVTTRVLPYSQLMQELDVTNVRELEDFLIECMYAGIGRVKLDQVRRCFEVQFAAGRDLRPGQLRNMIHTLSDWLSTSDNMLHSIQEKIQLADAMSKVDKKHQKDVEDRIEEIKKTLILKGDNDFRAYEETYSESGGVMDYEEDRNRPEREASHVRYRKRPAKVFA